MICATQILLYICEATTVSSKNVYQLMGHHNDINISLSKFEIISRLRATSQAAYIFYSINLQWELEKMTRLEQVTRTRHYLALRERLRHGHENSIAPNDFTKTEKVRI